MTYSEKDVICPYFSKMKIKDGRISITCKSFADEIMSTNLYFEKKVDRQAYLEQFCCDYCYKGCSLAIAISEYEEMKGGGKL